MPKSIGTLLREGGLEIKIIRHVTLTFLIEQRFGCLVSGVISFAALPNVDFLQHILSCMGFFFVSIIHVGFRLYTCKEPQEL